MEMGGTGNMRPRGGEAWPESCGKCQLFNTPLGQTGKLRPVVHGHTALAPPGLLWVAEQPLEDVDRAAYRVG